MALSDLAPGRFSLRTASAETHGPKDYFSLSSGYTTRTEQSPGLYCSSLPGPLFSRLVGPESVTRNSQELKDSWTLRHWHRDWEGEEVGSGGGGGGLVLFWGLVCLNSTAGSQAVVAVVVVFQLGTCQSVWSD